ncbi:hypothetical protein GCM10010522_32510 [Kribbella solani]
MISRRAFTVGLGVAMTGVTPAFAGRTPGQPAYDEQTLWDASSGPLANYHVHGLTVLPDDTILAFCEGRHEVCDAGPRDLLMRRSTDKGDTWSESQVVVPSVDGQSWGNPAAVYDRQTHEVFLFYALSDRLPENTSCSGDTGVLHVISSKDKGVTWGEPRVLDLFDHFGYDWALHSPGPGHGIQLDNGRLLMNVAHRRVIVGNTVVERMYGVASVYSDDHGRTWQTTGAVPVSADYPINEARLVQLDDGSVLINGRYAAGGNRQRIVSVSKDRGLTWSAPVMDGGTGTFNAVDAGMLGYTRGRVLFSRPDSPMRYNMTVSVSYDGTESLRYSRVINPGRSYYSDLARLSDGTIVLIYGCDGDIPSFPLRVNVCRFNLEWLTQGRDSLASGPRLRSRSYPVEQLTCRVVAPGPGEYELWLRYHRSPDGGLVSVTVDGQKPRNYLIDTTSETAAGYDVLLLGTMQLSGGPHGVRFAAAGTGRGGGQAVALDKLTLTQGPAAPDVSEEITVDNGALGYSVVAGSWPSGTGVPGYYSGNYASHAPGAGTAQVRWQPCLPGDGRYEVQVSYTAASNRSTAAPYTVAYAGGSSTVLVDQTVRGAPDSRGGEWVSLGTYTFAAGLAASVSLTDAPSGYVVADAVRFLRR